MAFCPQKVLELLFLSLGKGGGRGVRLIYSISVFMSCLLNFTKRFRTGSYATGIARRQFLRYKRALPFLVSFTDFRPQFMYPDCVRIHKSLL